MSSRPGSQSRYVEVNGQRLHYKHWSESGPPLILLHAATTTSSSWNIIAPRLASEFRVMAFDLRGHGLSSKPGQGYSWAEHYAEDLVEFLNARVLSEILEGEAGYRAEYWFPRVSCQSLVILGSPDMGGVVSLGDRPRLERLLNGVRLVEWGDVGHKIHIMRPDRFTAAVKAFLQSLPE